MTDKPARRHTALQPLSRHHHHALVLAQLLVKQQETPDVLKEKIKAFWTNGGQEHFREEEEVLLPEFAKHANVARPEILDLLVEHIQVRSLINEICNENKVEKMVTLGELLRSHIHKEERVVFPMIESALTEEQLQSLEPYFSEHRQAHVIDYTFVNPLKE